MRDWLKSMRNVGIAMTGVVLAVVLASAAHAQPPHLSPIEIKEIQERLNSLGYILTADGVVGQQTRNAIRGFAKLIGVESDGHPTAGILEALREKTRSTSLTSNSTPISASEPVWKQKYREAFDVFQRKDFAGACKGFRDGIGDQLRSSGVSFAQQEGISSRRAISIEDVKKIDSSALAFFCKA